MNLNYNAFGFFPFLVPQLTAPGVTGPGTLYPVGLSLGQAMQLYWRAQNLTLTANGSAQYAGLTQSLQSNGPLPPRNAQIGNGTLGIVNGFAPVGPGSLTPGYGWDVIVPGSGSLTASGTACRGGNNQALLNLEVLLFFPAQLLPQENAWPLVHYQQLWWPAFTLQSSVTNTVNCQQGGSLSYDFNLTTLTDPNFPTPLGRFTLLGQAVPVFAPALQPAAGGFPAETRSFSGSLVVAQEWT